MLCGILWAFTIALGDVGLTDIADNRRHFWSFGKLFSFLHHSKTQGKVRQCSAASIVYDVYTIIYVIEKILFYKE